MDSPPQTASTRDSAAGSGARAAGPAEPIPFNRPFATGREFDHIRAAIENLHLSGNGPFGARCSEWVRQRTDAHSALLTGSGTSALEMAMLLCGVGPGDEVILPSFTFVTSASAVVLRGATPVFVDIRADTLNLDERLIEDAIGPRTRAVMAVHYAGVACEMDTILEIAARHGLLVLEDAAQAIMASYRERPLGGIGDLGCLSFHETKNLSCGEGGALLVNRPDWVDRAHVLQEKGTNRAQFFAGRADRYTWVDVGSSFLTSEINAAFLWAQIEQAQSILERRLAIWDSYHERFDALERAGALRRPVIPPYAAHNGHLYYLLLESRALRDRLIEELAREQIQAVFHYVPLHSSPAGRRYGRPYGDLPVTDRAGDTLVRLPLWVQMTESHIERVVGAVTRALG